MVLSTFLLANFYFTLKVRYITEESKMGKSIRSKSKKQNRQVARSTRVIPAMKKKQEAMSLAIQTEITSKSGSTIENLKNVFSLPSTAVEPVDALEENNTAEYVDVPTKKQRVSINEKMKELKRKKRGSKPKFNAMKKLEWFE